MAIVRGFQTIAAIATEGTYGTEVATTRKLRYLGDDLDRNYSFIENEALQGIASRGKPDQGLATLGGTLTTDWDLTAADLLFARFFGSVTGTPPAGVYSLADHLDDIGFTLAIGKVVDEWCYTGCKIGQLVLSGAPGQAMQCAWSIMPNGLTLSSVLNTQAVLDALAEPAAARVLFHHLNTAFWVDDLTDALTSANAYKINNYQLTINRNMEQFHATAQLPEQARESNFMDVELQVTMPLYEDNVFVLAHANHTALQCKTTWTRGAVAKIIRIPKMYVSSAPVPIDGPGLIPRTVTFKIYHDLENENTITEMDFTEPLRLNET